MKEKYRHEGEVGMEEKLARRRSRHEGDVGMK